MFTIDQVERAIAEAVAAHPNRRNPYDAGESSCVYTGKGGAHCIAGQALIILGFEDRLPQYGECENAISVESLFESMAFVGEFDDGARELLTLAQGIFDGVYGKKPKWSTAYNTFKARVNEIRGKAEDASEAEAAA